jgi:hypothetical protein
MFARRIGSLPTHRTPQTTFFLARAITHLAHPVVSSPEDLRAGLDVTALR